MLVIISVSNQAREYFLYNFHMHYLALARKEFQHYLYDNNNNLVFIMLNYANLKALAKFKLLDSTRKMHQSINDVLIY